MKAGKNSLEHALEEAVSRALRDNLAPLQRTADELHHAYADLVAACASSRPSNALPSLLRAQTAAASLAAGLSVLSNFVAVALNPREQSAAGTAAASAAGTATAVEELDPPVTAGASAATEAWEEEPEEVEAESEAAAEVHAPAQEIEEEVEAAPVAASSVVEAPAVHAEPETMVAEPVAAAFDVKNLSAELQDLHKRANRVAKVAMQDIQLLQPKEVKSGREHKDICVRLRSDIDKARKEYDRRFRAIQDHPVDYFHHWMVEILAGGDSKALGEYPYPSSALRQ